jgi:hypothetical protein
LTSSATDLCNTPDVNETILIKFKLLIDPSYSGDVLKCLRHKGLDAMSAGLWNLRSEQVAYIAERVGQPLPMDMEMLIGVVRTK